MPASDVVTRDEVLSQMNEVDRAEAVQFAKDVQGNRVDSDDEDIGPALFLNLKTTIVQNQLW